MLSYDGVTQNPEQFLACTSLTVEGNSSGGADGSVMPSAIKTFYTFGPKWAVLGRHS